MSRPDEEEYLSEEGLCKHGGDAGWCDGCLYERQLAQVAEQADYRKVVRQLVNALVAVLDVSGADIVFRHSDILKQATAALEAAQLALAE